MSYFYPFVQDSLDTPFQLPTAAFYFVNNCLWLVSNANYNSATSQWEQDDPNNPALPAYALEQCANGSLQWLVAQPAGGPNIALSWVTVWGLDQYGEETVSPLTLTSQTQIASQVNPTWNAGSGATMVARAVSVTDTSSSTESALDQLSVNSVIKWKVRKDGTLEIGNVPSSAITGGLVAALVAGTGISITPAGPPNTYNILVSHGDYVDLGNTQTITGVKTIANFSPLQFLQAGSAIQSDSSGAMYVSYGATLLTGDTWQANQTTATIIGLSPTGIFSLYYNTGLAIGFTFTPALVFAIDSTGQIVTGGGAVTPAQIAAALEGTGGIATSYDAINNKADIDGSAIQQALPQAVLVTFVSTPGAVSQTATLPILPGASTVTYFLQAQAKGFDWNTAGDSGTVTLAGSGATWASNDVATAPEYNRQLLIAGTAVGGQTPVVTLSGNYTKAVPSGVGIITLTAIVT